VPLGERVYASQHPEAYPHQRPDERDEAERGRQREPDAPEEDRKARRLGARREDVLEALLDARPHLRERLVGQRVEVGGQDAEDEPAADEYQQPLGAAHLRHLDAHRVAELPVRDLLDLALDAGDADRRRLVADRGADLDDRAVPHRHRGRRVDGARIDDVGRRRKRLRHASGRQGKNRQNRYGAACHGAHRKPPARPKPRRR